MPRIARGPTAGVVSHVVNRGNGRATVFHDDADFAAFVDLLGEASERAAVRLLGCCLMPNHVHLVVRPTGEADLSRWMRGNRGQATFKVGKTGNLTYDGRFAFRVE